MSRRIKLLIAALFLVLLGIPATYIVLSWTTPTPLEFHYLRTGTPFMDPERERMQVSILIEVRNPQPYPIHLLDVDLMGTIVAADPPEPPSVNETGETGDESTGAAAAHPKIRLAIGNYRSYVREDVGVWMHTGVPPVPARGSVQVEVQVPQGLLSQTDLKSLGLNYLTISDTRFRAMRLCEWLERTLWDWFKYDRRVNGPGPDRHQAALHGTIDPPVSSPP